MSKSYFPITVKLNGANLQADNKNLTKNDLITRQVYEIISENYVVRFYKGRSGKVKVCIKQGSTYLTQIPDPLKSKLDGLFGQDGYEISPDAGLYEFGYGFTVPAKIAAPSNWSEWAFGTAQKRKLYQIKQLGLAGEYDIRFYVDGVNAFVAVKEPSGKYMTKNDFNKLENSTDTLDKALYDALDEATHPRLWNFYDKIHDTSAFGEGFDISPPEAASNQVTGPA